MNWQVSTNMYRKLQIIVHLVWTLSCDKRGWLVPPSVNMIDGDDAPWSPSSPASPLPCCVIRNHRFSVDSVKSEVHEPLGRYTTSVEKTIHAPAASNIRPGVGLFLDTSAYDCIYFEYRTDAMHRGVDAAYRRRTTPVSTPVGTECITDDGSALSWWHAFVSLCIQFDGWRWRPCDGWSWCRWRNGQTTSVYRRYMFGMNLPDTVKVAAVVGICSNGRIRADDIIIWRAVKTAWNGFFT